MNKNYNIRLMTRQGIQTINVIAKNAEEARDIVKDQGRVVSLKASFSLTLSRPMGRSERITLLKRLGMMSRSRVSLTKALTIIHESFNGPISRTAKAMKTRIIAGDDIIQAMEALPADFPRTTVSLVKSGMHSGEIHQAFENAANFEYEMFQIGKTARNGLMNAAFEFLMASVLIIATAFWIGPWVLDSEMMKSAGDAVNIDWAFVLAYTLAGIIILVLTVSIFLLSIAYIFKPIAPNFADNLTLKIPVFRDLVLSKTYYSVFYGLSLLIASGVRIKESLYLSSRNAPPGAVHTDLVNAMKALEEGEEWAYKMANLHPTDRACLATSQDRSEIADAFRSVAMSHRDNYSQRISQVIPALSVFSNLLMAFAGFLIFAMMMLPNLQLVKGIL